jgi:hypothetical protein
MDASRPGRTETWLSAMVTPGAQEELEEQEKVESEEKKRISRVESTGPMRGRRATGSSTGGGTESPARGRRAAGSHTPGEVETMVRLFLRVGRRDGVRPADMVGAIANEAGISGDQIGDIDLYDTFSFVEVPQESGQKVIAALNRTTIRGHNPQATIALPDIEGQGRDRSLSARDQRDIGRRGFPRSDRMKGVPRRPASTGRKGLGRPYGARQARGSDGGGSSGRKSGRS